MADGLLIAAPSSGVGKTIVTVGLLAALKARGVRVGSAKVGPDYIDPRFHERATGRPSPNLDPWAMRPALLTSLASAGTADLIIIEGVMGLFDGPLGGYGSTADVANLLKLPVILVIDASRQGQSVAALAQGFVEHRADVAVAGVMLNRVGSARHEAILRSALASRGIEVFGAIGNGPELALKSRHLGLVQASEITELDAMIDAAGARVASSVDLDRMVAMAHPIASAKTPPKLAPLGQRIAVASDHAFAFTYPHMLEGWRAQGADVLPFSPLADEPPAGNADAVFLPGGYPELHAGRLAGNARFLAGLADAAARRALIYGECGGYMVLGEGLTDAQGQRHRLAGLLPHETSFAERRLHLGYRRLRHDGALPWPPTLRGHEFHYSRAAETAGGEALFRATDSEGEPLSAMGGRVGRVMGSYAHVIDAEEPGE